MEEPIFQSIEQAIHVAFLMDILPVTQKSPMQVVIDKMKEDAGILQEREGGSINFGGMTALEIRAQCAMIRASVQDHLPSPERDAIWARYGYQLCKARGVRGVRDYAKPQLSISGDEATLALTWSIYCASHQRKDFSLQKLADEYGFSKTNAHRNVKKIKEVGMFLRNRGIGRLEGLFAGKGVV